MINRRPIGTSLPELAATLLAVIRKHSSVALGNVVGSNIFNIGLIMGLTALAEPGIKVADHVVRVDMWVMLAASLLIALLAWRRAVIGKGIGTAMLAAYAIYTLLLFLG